MLFQIGTANFGLKSVIFVIFIVLWIQNAIHKKNHDFFYTKCPGFYRITGVMKESAEQERYHLWNGSTWNFSFR